MKPSPVNICSTPTDSLAAMSDPRAELSSISSALQELTSRISLIAEQSSNGNEDLSRDLFEVERALTAAHRRLAKRVN